MKFSRFNLKSAGLFPADASDIRKKQLFCVAGALLLALASCALNQSASFLQNGQCILRGGYGESEAVYTLQVDGLSEQTETIELTVSPRAYTKEEAERSFAELMEVLPALVCGENPSLQHVTNPLNFVKSVPAFAGIRLQYSPADASLIAYDGTVFNEQLSEAQETQVFVRMRTGSYSRDYSLSIGIDPKTDHLPEHRREQLLRALAEADEAQKSSAELKLPAELDGISLRYRTPPDKTPFFILALGFLSAFLLSRKPEEDRKKAEKLRQRELLLDYSELVSKLIVYIGAGLTIRNAWSRIVSDYERARTDGTLRARHLYEEMRLVCGALAQGVPEQDAYLAFARRCALKPYLRLISLLEQNRKNGDKFLLNTLEIELQEALEERKHTAKRLAEEASTKLTAPLFLSLIGIMAIVILPALLQI